MIQVAEVQEKCDQDYQEMSMNKQWHDVAAEYFRRGSIEPIDNSQHMVFSCDVDKSHSLAFSMDADLCECRGRHDELNLFVDVAVLAVVSCELLSIALHDRA